MVEGVCRKRTPRTLSASRYKTSTIQVRHKSPGGLGGAPSCKRTGTSLTGPQAPRFYSPRPCGFYGFIKVLKVDGNQPGSMEKGSAQLNSNSLEEKARETRIHLQQIFQLIQTMDSDKFYSDSTTKKEST